MSATVSSASAEAGEKKGVHRRVRSPVVPATGSDHEAVFCFLTSILRAPTVPEFRASLEDPFYEPRDRLLLKRNNRMVAPRPPDASGDAVRPAANPDHRLEMAGRGTRGSWTGPRHSSAHGRRETGGPGRRPDRIPADNIPHYFRRTGWALCGQPCTSLANTRTVLARLLDEGLRRNRHQQNRRLHIRPWRRWEEAALVRIYRQNLSGAYAHWTARRLLAMAAASARLRTNLRGVGWP